MNQSLFSICIDHGLNGKFGEKNCTRVCKKTKTNRYASINISVINPLSNVTKTLHYYISRGKNRRKVELNGLLDADGYNDPVSYYNLLSFVEFDMHLSAYLCCMGC